MKIDLGGNWRKSDAFPPHLNTREPPLRADEERVFGMPDRKAELQFEYAPEDDLDPDKRAL